ncbi:MAG: hypothetical protein AAF488_12525 [Planctomycetota bacterium]
MARNNFWENVGRSVGHGWKKAKDLGNQLGDHAEGRMDLREARDTLQSRYEDLGKQVFERIETGKEISFTDDDVLRSLIDRIRDGEEAVEEIEERIESLRRGDQRDDPDGDLG